MTQNISLAIIVAMLSSLAFAAGATVQGHAVGRHVGDNTRKERIPLSDLWVLVRTPRWLAGLLLAGLGSVLNATGLMLAPVTVVQPVGVLAVPWAVILEATFRHRRIPRMEWAAVGLTLVGTVGFTVLSASHVSSGTGFDAMRVAIACAAAYVAAEGLGRVGARGRRAWRSLFWAMGGGFFYGLEAALIRTMRDFASVQADWVRSPVFWGMALALVIGSVRGGWMIQQAYATGVSETMVGAVTVTNPVVAVLFGVVVLGEGARITAGMAFWMAVSAAAAILGVAILSQVGSAARPAQPSPHAG